MNNYRVEIKYTTAKQYEHGSISGEWTFRKDVATRGSALAIALAVESLMLYEPEAMIHAVYIWRA